MTDIIRLSGLLCAVGALSACAATTPTDGTEPLPPARETGGSCDAAPAQSFIGRTATAELGGQILAATGAERLRWGPPDTAFTMDYRPDRVNVMYDGAMTVIEIRCG